MPKANSTQSAVQSKADLTPDDTRSKPERPEGSPLFWHPSGRWCKKIRGKQHYFGRGSHEDALAEYNKQKVDLHSRRVPREEPEGSRSTICVPSS